MSAGFRGILFLQGGEDVNKVRLTPVVRRPIRMLLQRIHAIYSENPQFDMRCFLESQALMKLATRSRKGAVDDTKETSDRIFSSCCGGCF